MGEVRGAIERVYMPGAARSASLPTAFLAQNGIIRERGGQGANNHRLSPAVELGHQINIAGLEMKLGPVPPPLQQDGRC